MKGMKNVETQRSLLLWHYAVNTVHRKVAVASFLGAAQTAHVPVYYAQDDPAAALVTAVADSLGIPLHPLILEELSESTVFPPASAWIGIHREKESPQCTLFRRLPRPPQFILCLGEFPQDKPPAATLPPHHEPFKTGNPLILSPATDQPSSSG